jgi:cytidyltransferase-like protein
MKSFLDLVEEKEGTKKPVVMAFGRMNPPTTGHLKLIDKVKEVADKHNAKHTVVVSHSQDSKKNPLSGDQKIKHLKRYSSGTHFETSSKETPTFLQHAAKLHAKGHDHLIMVAGSDRVKEYKEKLDKYNGTHEGALYNFKKIQVVSAGHRDPDAEGAEGMSGTKMREHAKNKDFSSFRQGVPSHVSDSHAKELMKDTRAGMGLNESVDRGQFRAIFVTGGPGSGKDVIIREAIAESRIVELNVIQAYDYLSDKQKLSEKSNDFRREGIRTRGPLIINGPADDNERIGYIKEELEELGYETMMIFVNTTNEASQERNSLLSRMMVESVRQDKWLKAQENTKYFTESFPNFIEFDNTDKIETKEEDITEIYLTTKLFLDSKVINEAAEDWFKRNNKVDINERITSLFKEYNVKPNSKSIQIKTVGKYNSTFRAKGPADIKPDNSGSLVSGRDQVKGDTGPRKNTGIGSSVTGGAWHSAYEEAKPTLKISPQAKEPNFQKDNDKEKVKKRGNTSLSAGRVGRPDGVGQSYDTRAGGQGAAAGAGLGQAMGESEDFSNAQPSSAAMPGSSAMSPNPLSSAYDTKKKEFGKFRKNIKEFNGFQNDVESGVGGGLGGSGNKEGMDTYKDQNRNIGIEIVKKKKKKFNEDHVKELEDGLQKLDSHGYMSIHKLMMDIAKKHSITGKNLHDDFKDKHGKIPDDWIKDKK